MPPTMTATLPLPSTRLKFFCPAGTLPIQAMKWRQKGILNTLSAATL
jgi:hypothetical protein